jgi:hypothetical protein
VGTDVNVTGFIGAGNPFPLDHRLWSGPISIIRNPSERRLDPAARYRTIGLQFPIVEGVSGAPLTAFHNGVKVWGLAYGSEEQRVTAYDVVEVREGATQYRETTQRIVETGLTFHPSALIAFLKEVEASGYVVSSDPVPHSGL